MNDADRKAFEDWWWESGEGDQREQKEAWQAACKWKKSQLTISDYDYAKSIAQLLWEKHYKQDAPNWKPLGDCFGVLTQIDNMTVGLSKAPPRVQINQQLVEALEYLLTCKHGEFCNHYTEAERKAKAALASAKSGDV